MRVSPGQYTKDLTTSAQTVWENSWISGGKTRSRKQKSWRGQGCKAYILFQTLAQLRWTGQVTRTPDEQLSKKVFYGELQVGKRSKGDQNNRYMDTIGASLKDFNIPSEAWKQTAQDRTKWKTTMKPRESARLNKCANRLKSEPRDHHQNCQLQNWLTLFVTDTLELRLV